MARFLVGAFMRKLQILVLTILCSFALLSSPAHAAGCQKKSGTTGAVVGGAIGGILGNRIAGKRNRTVGTIVGVVAGAVVGSAVARKLDDCEKEKMAEATVAAANDDRNGASAPQVWKSDTRDDVSGTVVAGEPTMTDDGQQCRVVTQVSYVNGEEVRETPTLCRTPPQTNWAMQQT